MKTALALVLCSTLAFGQDAPLADPVYPFIADLPPVGRTMEVEAGNLVPFDATCLDKGQAKRAAKVSAYFEDKSKDQSKNVSLPTPAFIALLGGAGVAVVTAVVLGVALAQKKPAP